MINVRTFSHVKSPLCKPFNRFTKKAERKRIFFIKTIKKISKINFLLKNPLYLIIGSIN